MIAFAWFLVFFNHTIEHPAERLFEFFIRVVRPVLDGSLNFLETPGT